LDSLNPRDIRAVRSRKDLRWIDVFLGNSRWILRQLKAHFRKSCQIFEIGAGEGALCQKLFEALPSSIITGLDLVERPSMLPEEICWVTGDFLQTLSTCGGDTCVGSLVLHHFSDEDLGKLGIYLQSFRLIIFCEPYRSRLPLFLAPLAFIFMGEVTRHDMPVSIRAGFRKGELPKLLGLDTKKWTLRESAHWRGSIRLLASRHLIRQES